MTDRLLEYYEATKYISGGEDILLVDLAEEINNGIKDFIKGYNEWEAKGFPKLN